MTYSNEPIDIRYPPPLRPIYPRPQCVAVLHQRAKRSVAFGQYVVRVIQGLASAAADLAPLHQAIYRFLCYAHTVLTLEITPRSNAPE